MLTTVIEQLSFEQREKLLTFGITKQLISAWKLDKRLPTEVQVIALAEVTGVDRHALQDEVALLRATPQQRTALERLMKRAHGLAAGVAMGVALVIAVASLSFGAPGRLFSRR